MRFRLLVSILWPPYPCEYLTQLIKMTRADSFYLLGNWIFNFLIVMITPIAFENIGYQTYIIFAVINAFIVPCVYFFYPETAYRSLEEMDVVFGSVEQSKREADITERQRALDEQQPSSVHSETVDAKA